MNGSHVLDALFVEFEFLVCNVFFGNGYEAVSAGTERVLVIRTVTVELLGVGVV